MTIDELFSKPISNMREWMKNHYTDPRGYCRGSYWFYNIDECFDDLQIPEDSNWRIIPVMTGFSNNGNSALDQVKRYYSDKLKFGVAKKSKYGELLVYVFSGTLNEKTSTKSGYYHRDYEYVLENIYYNDAGHGGMNCRVFLDGKDVVNNSQIAVPYRMGDKAGDDRWINQYEFLDKYTSVDFVETPILKGLSKNKHSLNEYAEKLEAYAKKVQEIGKPAYDKNKNIIGDDDFVVKSSAVHVKPADAFYIWLALYIENQNVTFDDMFGIIKLTQSTEKRYEDYVTSCKGGMWRKDYDGKWHIREAYHYYMPYYLSLLCGKTANINVSGWLPLVKNLEKTREMYNEIGSYKEDLKNASKEYRESFTEIAKTFESEIRKIYKKINKELDAAKDKYLADAKALYDGTHEKYPSVNDKDLGAYDNIPGVVDNIKKEFENTAVRLMRLVNVGYKGGKNTDEDDDDNIEFTEEFKNHAKILFDACPDLEKIPYFAVGKCYDAPYELYDNEEVGDKISDDVVYEYEEKYGQGSFDDWLTRFEELSPYPENWKEWDDLYPGWECVLYINRDLEPEEEEEEC